MLSLLKHKPGVTEPSFLFFTSLRNHFMANLAETQGKVEFETQLMLKLFMTRSPNVQALCRFPPDLLSGAGDEGGEPFLLRMANARNISLQSLHGGSIYLINLVDKSKVLCFASPPTQHQSSSRNLG